MNKRVLKTIIYLCWAFLITFAVLKVWFAEQFVIVVNNPRIIEAGQFIDNHKWLYYSLHFITTLLTYQFYLCACCKVWHLSWEQYLTALPFIIGAFLLNLYVSYVGVIIGFLVMFLLPYLFKAKYKDTVIILIAHCIGQLIISFVRSQPFSLADINILTQLICGIDMYIWLLLYYLYSNLYKESIIMGTFAPPVWCKMENQIQAEIDKINAQIANTSDDKKKAKLIAKRQEYEKLLADSKK